MAVVLGCLAQARRQGWCEEAEWPGGSADLDAFCGATTLYLDFTASLLAALKGWQEPINGALGLGRTWRPQCASTYRGQPRPTHSASCRHDCRPSWVQIFCSQEILEINTFMSILPIFKGQ